MSNLAVLFIYQGSMLRSFSTGPVRPIQIFISEKLPLDLSAQKAVLVSSQNVKVLKTLKCQQSIFCVEIFWILFGKSVSDLCGPKESK